MGIELKSATPQEFGIYQPYYSRDPNKSKALPYAIHLYQQAELKGERHIEGSIPVPFTAVWRVTKLPADLTLCRVSFNDDADQSYEIILPNSEFIGYLAEVVLHYQSKEYFDFPQVFYSKLFRIKLTGSDM